MSSASSHFAAAALAASLFCSPAAFAAGHTIVHPGEQPSTVGSHSTFTGSVRHDSVARADENSHYTVSYVTFEPGARTFWHTHPVPDSAF